MEKPAPLAHPLLDAPKYLLDWPSWAAWTAPVKRPLDLRRHLRPASTTEPDSWAAFSYARDYLARAVRYAPPAIPLQNGVGILVAPPLVFIDFDDMLPEPDSVRPAWVEAFLQRAADIGGFTEWSGSGTGAHAFVRVSPTFPALTRNRYTRAGPHGPIGVEVYTHHRFAALTGFPYFPPIRPQLNEPKDGDALLIAFVAEMGVAGAPILSPPLVTPITVPIPTRRVLDVTRTLLTPTIEAAFANPQAAFAEWAARREQKSLDNSLSAWRFSLYSEASRHSQISPLPVYELFNPKTEPAHPGIPEWQEVSGYKKKPHRVYADIQRAHALVMEEARLLALDLGEPPPPPPPPPPRHPANADIAASWAQLGLVMKVLKNAAVPIASSVNFIRIISRHPHFSQWRIERNSLDGTTRVNRQPITDTLATRFLEPVRNILDLGADPPIQAVRDAIEVVADDSPYDPLVEYLRGLPKWSTMDNELLLSSWLEKIGAAPDADTARYSRRILLGLVARALSPGIKFDYVPVFEGPQGVGKSTLVSHLVTPDFYAVLSESLQSKDAKVVLRGKWGVELAEMAAFKRSDEEARKAFFSAPCDDFRPPYGRASIKVPRRTILFGTTNDKQYLTDHTGARRYWPIHFPSEINLQWFLDHRDLLFAEAVHHYDLGEKFHDTMAEAQAPERLAVLESRMVTPAWQTKVIEHLRALPWPKLPENEDDQGNSGIVTTQYVANLQHMLDLPPAIAHMSDAQLASFLRRAGYTPRVLSFRHEGMSKKVYGWAHRALSNLTEEQGKAFLSFFPSLFPQNVAPAAWVEHRHEHLAAALQHLPRPE